MITGGSPITALLKGGGDWKGRTGEEEMEREDRVNNGGISSGRGGETAQQERGRRKEERSIFFLFLPSLPVNPPPAPLITANPSSSPAAGDPPAPPSPPLPWMLVRRALSPTSPQSSLS